jgi:hypothetical protein
MQQEAGSRVSFCVNPDDPGDVAAVCLPGAARPRSETGDSAEVAVGALYQASVVSLIRLAWIMLGDRPSAEDVVQEAFCDLYRRWDRLARADSALYYVRSSVLNGCRSVLRRRVVRRTRVEYELPAITPEAAVLNGEERVELIRALGSSIEGMRQVAEQANAGAPYDAVIHNAGVGYREPRHVRTDDGLEHVFAITMLAPYLLTA